MIHQAADRMAALGARRCGPSAFDDGGTLIRIDAQATGQIALRIEIAPASPNSVIEALAANPEVGWSHALTLSGKLARRVVLSPRQWMVPQQLRQRLDELRGGVRDASHAAESALVADFWDASECATDDTGANALAAFLLSSDAASWDGCRHRIAAPLPSAVRSASLVGPNLVGRRHYRRHVSAVARALYARPDAAHRLLCNLLHTQAGGAQPSEMTDVLVLGPHRK